MWVIGRLTRALARHVRRVSWLAVLLALLVHMGVTWALLVLAGESALVAPQAFPYYYMTTATTIGYGDLSPQTTAGRLIVAFLLMPGAVAFFAAVLAKTSASLASYLRRHLVGRMTYEQMRGHTVLVGWRGAASDRLVDLLLSDTATDDEGLVLVACELDENPRPEQMRFVAAGNYADSPVYARASLQGADRIIIHTPSDDQSLAAVLAVMAHAPNAHVVAHFEGPDALQLVRSHYPQVECTRPMSAEVIARAAQDPGSSIIALELLSTATGPTQFSVAMPTGIATSACQVARCFKDQSALFLGMRESDVAPVQINPPDDQPVREGNILYYLARQRIDPTALACLQGTMA